MFARAIRLVAGLVVLFPTVAAAHEHNGSAAGGASYAFGSPKFFGPWATGEWACPCLGHNVSLVAHGGVGFGGTAETDKMGGLRFSLGPERDPSFSAWVQVMYGSRKNVETGDRLTHGLSRAWNFGLGTDLFISKPNNGVALALRIQLDAILRPRQPDDHWSFRITVGPSFRFTHD
jgi:hypothetical protein